MTFGNPKQLNCSPIFKLNCKSHKYVKQLKYLAVFLNKTLSFLPHLKTKSEEIEKIAEDLYKFFSLSGSLPPHFLKNWYSCILQRKLAYACPV